MSDEQPLETGQDGRAVLETVCAPYETAGTGRRVALPLTPPEGKRPVELRLGRQRQPSRDGAR